MEGLDRTDSDGALCLHGKLDGGTLRFVLAPGRHLVGSAAGSEVELSHPSVSRVHAVIEVEETEVVVEDPGSRNGTFVNGTRVDRSVLHDGDMVHFGLVGLKVGTAGMADLEAAIVVACTMSLEDTPADLASAPSQPSYPSSVLGPPTGGRSEP